MPDPDAMARAEAARVLQQMHAHPGLSPLLAWAILLGLVGLAAWWASRTGRRRPRHAVARRLAVPGGVALTLVAGLASWAYLRALIVARVVCLPGKYSRSNTCGDGFIDASGIHWPRDNLISLYSNPALYVFEMALFGALLVGLWTWVFGAVRAAADWRELD